MGKKILLDEMEDDSPDIWACCRPLAWSKKGNIRSVPVCGGL
jgi:hypothetical protein